MKSLTEEQVDEISLRTKKFTRETRGVIGKTEKKTFRRP